MKLIQFPQQNVIIAKDQPEYLPMPAHIVDNYTICCWKLSWKERIKIFFSGRIWHWIMNFKQPIQPQLLELKSPKWSDK